MLAWDSFCGLRGRQSDIRRSLSYTSCIASSIRYAVIIWATSRTRKHVHHELRSRISIIAHVKILRLESAADLDDLGIMQDAREEGRFLSPAVKQRVMIRLEAPPGLGLGPRIDALGVGL
jgi:hypothetical protein